MTERHASRPYLLFVLLITVAGIAGAHANAEVPPSPAQGLAVSVDFVRDAAIQTLFVCTAEITDLATGEVVAAPKIQFRTGAPAKTQTTWKAEGSKTERAVVVNVSAATDSNSVSYTVTDLRAGKTFGIYKGSLTLR